MGERRYAIWGSAGHAQVLADLLVECGGRLVALFDNRETASAIEGVPLHIGSEGFERWACAQERLDEIYGLVAIGGHRGRDRMAIQALFARRGLKVDCIVHPSAVVSKSASLGAGTQILAQAVVAAEASLGAACIVNHRASVDHECVVGNGVHLAPAATLCGCVTLGDNVLVGAGAVVLSRLSIGDDVLIGAGAVVTRDVPAGAVVHGNPARVHPAR